MVNLAFWQLDRLHGRKAANRAIASAMSAPAAHIDSVDLPSQVRGFSKVRVTGTWDGAHTVYRRYPIVNGVQGYEVLEPLRVNGGAIVVDRGFIPIEKGESAARPAASAAIVVTIEGLARDDERASGTVRQNTGSPPIPTVTTVNIGQLRPLMGDTQLAPQWVQLTSPATATDPAPLPGPTLDNGPHWSYALQWFGFTAVITIGWIILCWRTVRRPEAQ